MTMHRPPEVGDHIIYKSNEGRIGSEIYRITDIYNGVVKYVLVSETTPVRDIRKFYKKSNRKYEDDMNTILTEWSLNVRSVYDAEIAVVNETWKDILEVI